MSLGSSRGPLTGGDRTLLAGSAVVLLSLLLPWWDSGAGSTANGLHDWGWLSVLSLVLTLALFAVRRLGAARRRPQLALRDGQAYVAGGAAVIVGAVVFWLAGNASLHGHVRFGVLVCVVGGAIVAAGGWMKDQESAPPGA